MLQIRAHNLSIGRQYIATTDCDWAGEGRDLVAGDKNEKRENTNFFLCWGFHP
jgi:hypothetical protein